MAKKSFAYDKMFGSDLPSSLQEKLTQRQNDNVGINFGETASGTAEDFNKTTYGRENQFSARTTWARMWCVVQNYSIDPSMAEAQKKALENSENYKAEVVVNDINVFQINNHKPHHDGGALDYQENSNTDFNSFLTANEFNKPDAGITSVRVATSGKFGLVKETVVSFKVFNFRDYEEIVVPFFLTPGSTIFVDYGWNTSDIYDPETYLKGEGNSTSFEYKSFYDQIFGKSGVLAKSKGDMDCLIGLVSKFDAQIDAQGHFNCTLTMTSQNYALLDYDQDTGIKIHQEIENKVWDKIKMKILNETDADLQRPANESYGANTKKYMAAYVGSYETKNFFNQQQAGNKPNTADDKKSSIAGWCAAENHTGSYGPEIPLACAKWEQGVASAAGFMGSSGQSYDGYARGCCAAIFGGYPEDYIKSDAKGTFTVGTGENARKWGVKECERAAFTDPLKMGEQGSWKNTERIKFQVIPKKAYDIDIYFRMLDDKVASQVDNIEQISTDNAMYITFRYFAEILNDLLAYHPKEFTDGEISFVMEDSPVTFDRNLYIRQIFSTQIDKKQLMFLYPTRKREDWTKADSARTDIVTLNEVAGVKEVDLGDLFLNLDQVVSIFRGEKSVELALKTLLDKINDESFGIINLKPVPDPTINKGVTIADSNFIPRPSMQPLDNGETITDIFTFKAHSPDTVLTSVNLSMNMGGSALANRLAIQGATSERMLFPASDSMKVDIAIKDLNSTVGNNQYFAHLPIRDKNDSDKHTMSHIGVFKNSTIKSAPNAKKLEEDRKKVEKKNKQLAFANLGVLSNIDEQQKKMEKEKQNQNPPPPVPDKYSEAKKKLKLTDPEGARYFPKHVYLNDLHSYFKYKVKEREIETQSGANVFLPYQLTFDIYGISGLVPGHRFRLDYMPRRYRDNAYFVITKVDHDVTTQGWKTTVTAGMKLWGSGGMQRNIVKYKPHIYMSRSKLYSLGYNLEQMDFINDIDDPKDWWNIIPINNFKACRDSTREKDGGPSNYVWWASHDCVGVFEGSDYTCCKYPPDKEK